MRFVEFFVFKNIKLKLIKASLILKQRVGSPISYKYIKKSGEQRTNQLYQHQPTVQPRRYDDLRNPKSIKTRKKEKVEVFFRALTFGFGAG